MLKKAVQQGPSERSPRNKDGVKSWTTVVQDLTPSLDLTPPWLRGLRSLEAFLSILLIPLVPFAFENLALERTRTQSDERRSRQ